MVTEPVIDEGGNGTVLVDAINRALDEELSHNPKMLVFGEDVAGGKGGVFTATRHLTEKHGKDRVYNSTFGRVEHCWGIHWLGNSRL